eukprot:1137994-Pelagomonas_calceolata.AAC.2
MNAHSLRLRQSPRHKKFACPNRNYYGSPLSSLHIKLDPYRATQNPQKCSELHWSLEYPNKCISFLSVPQCLWPSVISVTRQALSFMSLWMLARTSCVCQGIRREKDSFQALIEYKGV